MAVERNKRDRFSNRKEVWSSWSEDYHKSLYQDVKEYPSLIIRHKYILDLFDLDGKRILDVGCGPGEMIRDLAGKDCKVCGIDISKGMLEVAQRNLQNQDTKKSISLGCGNIESLSFKENTFDGAICAGVVEYLKDDKLALGELNRILGKDGVLIVTVRNKICPARILDLITDIFKRNEVGRRLIRKLKNPFGDKKNVDTPFVLYRKHYPWKLDKILVEYGFRKEDFRYFHFYPFFVPLDKIFPSAFVKLGLKMERFAHSALGFLGSGYIVRARKIEDAGGLKIASGKDKGRRRKY